MRRDRVSFSIALPRRLYELLSADSVAYDVPKSHIINMLLMDYYKDKVEQLKLSDCGSKKGVSDYVL